jgi:hypothetical protein
MNPEVLLKNFDRIIEAPGAVTRLRRFVLDLAVRGKLVEQDEKEESASAEENATPIRCFDGAVCSIGSGGMSF